jgi:hypothetical protein
MFANLSGKPVNSVTFPLLDRGKNTSSCWSRLDSNRSRNLPERTVIRANMQSRKLMRGLHLAVTETELARGKFDHKVPNEIIMNSNKLLPTPQLRLCNNWILAPLVFENQLILWAFCKSPWTGDRSFTKPLSTPDDAAQENTTYIHFQATIPICHLQASKFLGRAAILMGLPEFNCVDRSLITKVSAVCLRNTRLFLFGISQCIFIHQFYIMCPLWWCNNKLQAFIINSHWTGFWTIRGNVSEFYVVHFPCNSPVQPNRHFQFFAETCSSSE